MRRQSSDSLWNKLSRKLRKQIGCCEVCSQTEYLHVHHLISKKLYPQFNLNVNNLMVLCGRCHNKVHVFTVWGSEWLRTHKPEQYAWVLKTMDLLEKNNDNKKQEDSISNGAGADGMLPEDGVGSDNELH